MKPNFTLDAHKICSFFGLYISVFFLTALNSSAFGQTTYTNERFSTLFNSTETAPVNTTFQGSTGTWSAVSTDANSTIAVKSEVSSTDLKLIVNANNLGTVSQNTATSPDVDLSMITCTTKFDCFFDLYTSNVTAGNTGTSIMLQLFDGTTWNTVWQKTADQLYTEYGANTWTTVGMMISTVYMGMANFKYRFITTNASGNLLSTTFYIDSPRIVNYNCPATAAVGNKVWHDGNSNGIQDPMELGIPAIIVKLAVAPGDTLTATTDADGVYMFTSLPPAGYKIVFPVVAEMDVTTSNAGGDDAMDSDISPSDRSVIVFLVDGETNTTIDAGLKPSVPLPVYMISFQGAVNKGKAELKWVVADNETAGRFIIEKSKDGITYSEAGVVFGTDKTGVEEYIFRDATAFSGKMFYRLKSYDKLDKAEYSKILLLSTEAIVADNIKLIGNPVTGQLTFTYSSAANESTALRIYDTGGRIVQSQLLSSRQGQNTASINLASTLAKGMYVMELTAGAERKTAKFIKQ